MSDPAPAPPVAVDAPVTFGEAMQVLWDVAEELKQFQRAADITGPPFGLDAEKKRRVVVLDYLRLRLEETRDDVIPILKRGGRGRR